MPNRYIRDGWIDSERINSLSVHAENFYLRLCLSADDFGRFDGRETILKSYLYPLKPEIRTADISRLLTECEKAGLLAVYNVEGKRYIEVLNFRQQIRIKNSKYPARQADESQSPGECLADDNQMPSMCTADDNQMHTQDTDNRLQDTDNRRQINTIAPNENRSRQKKEDRIYFDFEKSEWVNITKADVEGWREAYPAIDIKVELNKAREWLKNNPKNRKSNYGKFLVGWFSRSQDKAGRNGVNRAAGSGNNNTYVPMS